MNARLKRFIDNFRERLTALWDRFRHLSLSGFIRKYIVNSSDSNEKLALSIALGLFMSVTPIWGWQIVATMALAHFFKLNKFIAVATSNISLPPMLPLFIFFSFIVGGWILGTETGNITYRPDIGFTWIRDNLMQYVLGSLVFGASMSLVLGSFSYLLLRIFRGKQP